MTPKKDKVKHRDAAVVYPGTSPELMRAYRIFGPGHESLEVLDHQRNSILSGEGWETWLTPRGREIARGLNVDVDGIIAAYEAYKKDIERMNKVDRIHEKRKQAQLDGVGAEDEDQDGDESDGVEVVSSSSCSSGATQDDNEGGSDNNEVGPNNNEGSSDNNEGPSDKDLEETEEENSEGDKEDPLKKFLGPDLWLSQGKALAGAKALNAIIEQMHITVGSILDNYCEEFPNSNELSQAMEKFVRTFQKVRTYAYLVENLILLHDNKTPKSTWKSPDTVNVTYGDKVPETLYKFYELKDRVRDMQKALDICVKIRDRFLKTTLRDKKVTLMRCLMYSMRKFAAACCVEETRVDFLKELEEERERWKKNPPAKLPYI